jgi:hypothetical protein
MAAKKGSTLNKSEAIRRALAQHPDKGPVEIARMLTQQHGVPFHPKKVSTIKSKVKKQKPSPGNAAAPVAARKTAPPAAAKKAPAPAAKKAPPAAATKAPPAGGVAQIVTNLQAYIQRLGKGDLHRLIDTL